MLLIQFQVECTSRISSILPACLYPLAGTKAIKAMQGLRTWKRDDGCGSNVVEKKKWCEKEIDNLTQLVSTYEYFKVLHVFSCSFRMFHAGSTSFPGHSLGEICELCSSTTQHSAPHETTCRAVGGTGIRHTMKCQNMTPVKGIIHHDDTC